MRKCFTLALGLASAIAFAHPQSQQKNHFPVLSVSQPTPQQLDSLHQAVKEYYSRKEKSSTQQVTKRDSAIYEKYDTIAKKWNISSMEKYVYNKFGRDSILENLSFDKTNGSFTPKWKYVVTSDSKGNPTVRIEYSYDVSKKEWITATKTEFSYDANGNETELIYTQWDTTTKAWIPSYKYIYTENAEGLEVSTYYTFDVPTGKWVVNSKYESKYSNHKNTYRTYTKSTTDTNLIWIMSYGYTYTYAYNEIKDIIEKLDIEYYSYNYSTNKIDTTHTVDYYTTNDKKQTTSISQYIDSVLHEKINYTYDDKGNQLTDSTYLWDTVNKKWNNYSYSVKTFNANGNSTSNKQYYYSNDSWVLDHDYSYSYDSKNRNYETSYKNFYSSTSYGSKYQYEFLDDNHVSTQTYSSLIGGKWVMRDRSNYYYSAKDIIVINPTTEAKGSLATKPCLFPPVTSGIVKVKLGEAAYAKLIIANASGKTMVSKSVEDGEEIELIGSGQFFYRISTLKTTESGVILKP